MDADLLALKDAKVQNFVEKWKIIEGQMVSLAKDQLASSDDAIKLLR